MSDHKDHGSSNTHPQTPAHAAAAEHAAHDRNGAPPVPPKPSAPAEPIAGAFEFEAHKHGAEFNLRPVKDHPVPIPDDQRKVSQGVYEIRNVLMLLKEQGAFRSRTTWPLKTSDGEKVFDEFIARAVQVGEVGCTGPSVDTSLASAALDQIRADIVRRKGRRIINQYLFSLGVFALFGIAIGAALYVVARYVVPTPLSPPPSFNTIFGGYGCIIGGAMVGAWLSVAAGRREVSFDGIPDFLNYGYEPAIRMGFVAVLASVLGLFVQLKILSLSLGNNNLANFILPNQEALAIGIGVIAGIGERALSVQLIERAQNVLSPGKL